MQLLKVLLWTLSPVGLAWFMWAADGRVRFW